MLGPVIVVLFMVMSIGADDPSRMNYVTATQVSRRHVNTASGAPVRLKCKSIRSQQKKHLCITSIKHYTPAPPPPHSFSSLTTSVHPLLIAPQYSSGHALMCPTCGVPSNSSPSTLYPTSLPRAMCASISSQ